MSFNKIIFVFSLILFFSSELFATHNRAGEITYRHISGYTFEFTVTTYTYIPSNANRNSLYVDWGDGTIQEVGLSNRQVLPNQYYFNTYITRHTFPGSGTYTILMEDPNRNLGVKNIPNSVNTVFSIKTTMLIGPFAGTNSTPILLNPPIDNAAKNHIFIHNPAAYDADGDSISYELTVCTAEQGNPIEGYSLPPSSDSIYIDEYYGDLTWITPIDTGIYNVALFIDEWRDGVKIGRITRDMQINVYNTDNNPPVTDPISNYCLIAGDTLELYVTSTDADNDPIEQYFVGTPTFDNSSTFEIVEAGAGYTTSKLTWITDCSHARQQPHVLVVKAEDQVNEIKLVDITSFYVKVLHPAPENLSLEPGTDNIKLTWDALNCGSPVGYNIYRRVDRYDFVADSCEFGVPSYTGYELIDVVSSTQNNSYTDDNQGLGLVPGFDYCYMITAIYNDGAESMASEELCSSLIPGVPAMLGVSVLNDNSTTGQIELKWAEPVGFDTVDDGPYRYEIYRQSPNESDYSLIGTIPTDLSDTVYTDQNINTLVFPYYYSVKLAYQNDAGEWIIHPGSETASSLFLELKGIDNAIEITHKKRSPWLNLSYDLFRRPEAGASFDSIGRTNSSFYTDNGLANNVPYTYRSVSRGTRPVNGTNHSTFNISHINTTEAVDSFPPCPPVPSVFSVCDSSYNILTWVTPQARCGDNDVTSYQVFYKPTLDGEMQLLETLSATDSSYLHYPDVGSLAAVYGVVAIDSFNNASDIGLVTIDSCIMFSLPNVFSPNGDGVNDIYKAYNQGGFVKKVEMSIFNRYGNLVYETTDPYINWNGQLKSNNKLVSSGVYYYICDYYEPRLTGEVHKILKGFIHVYSDNNNPGNQE